MNSRKWRGSLAKRPGRRGIFRSDPLDRDLRALKRWDLNLIVDTGFRSGGRGDPRATAVAEHAGDAFSGAGLTGLAKPGRPGTKTTRVWSWSTGAAWLNHWWAQA